METFKNIAMNYLQSTDDKRVQGIIESRHSLNGSKQKTLQELGDKHKISRERIRQIESRHLWELRKLIESHNKYKDTTSEVIKLANNSSIISQDRIFNLLNIKCNPNEWDLLLLKILSLSHLEDIKLIYTDKMTITGIKKTLGKVRMELRESIIPIKIDDLYKKVKPTLISLEEFKLLTKATGAKKIIISHVEYYQMPITSDWSAGNLAYQLLWENGVPMTTSELLDEMESKYKAVKGHLTTVNQMVGVKQIENIDNNTWALKEWDIGSIYVLDLMKQVIIDHGKPMEMNNILKGIREIKTDFREASVKAYTHLDIFDRLDDGRIAYKGY